MGFILSIFGWVFDLWLAFKTSVAERLGKSEQKNQDQSEVLKEVEKVNDIENKPIDPADIDRVYWKWERD